jgi:peptidylprolyl isomerase
MGFEKEILQEGNGDFPTAGKNVTVHCTGYGKNRDLSKKVVRCMCCMFFFK